MAAVPSSYPQGPGMSLTTDTNRFRVGARVRYTGKGGTVTGEVCAVGGWGLQILADGAPGHQALFWLPAEQCRVVAD